jgi:hypothetical protein
MQSDLEKNTAFDARIVRKEMDCLVLKRTSNKDKLRTRHPEALPGISFSGGYSITNKTLAASLLPNLVVAYQNKPYPIIDETGYAGPVDIVLNSKLYDLNKLRKELSKYDLDLVPQKRRVKMLVITDKKYSSN